jgi:hypothetical protein
VCTFIIRSLPPPPFHRLAQDLPSLPLPPQPHIYIHISHLHPQDLAALAEALSLLPAHVRLGNGSGGRGDGGGASFWDDEEGEDGAGGAGGELDSAYTVSSGMG